MEHNAETPKCSVLLFGVKRSGRTTAANKEALRLSPADGILTINRLTTDADKTFALLREAKVVIFDDLDTYESLLHWELLAAALRAENVVSVIGTALGTEERPSNLPAYIRALWGDRERFVLTDSEM
jgi:hypothetical protein